MTTLEEIEKTISELPPDELARFRAWFAEFDAKIWDARIKRDASQGALDKLAQQALKDHKAGRSKEL